jgi:putative membrane protein
METPDTWWLWFLSGVIAISAMVLPGLSGAFMLVLLGKYKGLLSAVTNQDFVTLLLVIAGAAVGIVSLAQLLGWLFKRYHDVTVAFLVGMLIGSLRKIWPWKDPLDSVKNVLPSSFTWEVVLAIVLLVAGFALVTGLNLWASRREERAD